MSDATKLLAGRRILLVEDEYFIAEDMASAFEQAGAEVVGPVACISDALQLIAGLPRLDGAVLDVNLHGEMVYPLADQLQSRGVPIVFATGYDEIQIPSGYRHASRCEKPVDAKTLAMALFGGGQSNSSR